jgi:hypothetical protein
VTPQAPLTGSGWREYSYGGFGGGHPHFRLHGDRPETGSLPIVLSACKSDRSGLVELLTSRVWIPA